MSEMEPKWTEWTFETIFSELAQIAIAKLSPEQAEDYFDRLATEELQGLMTEINTYCKYLSETGSSPSMYDDLEDEAAWLSRFETNLAVTVYLTNKWQGARIEWPT